MHFYGISLPPGQGPAKLEGLAVGEDLVVEKSTKPSRIMAAYLEALIYSMPNVAISFNIGYSCHYFVTQFWIICHNAHIPHFNFLNLVFLLLTILIIESLTVLFNYINILSACHVASIECN